MSYSCSDFYSEVMEAADASGLLRDDRDDDNEAALQVDATDIAALLHELADRKATEGREAASLRAALAWALERIADDLDPEHQEALAHARALAEGDNTASLPDAFGCPSGPKRLAPLVAVLRALAMDNQTPPADLERAALDVCDAYEATEGREP